MTDKEKGIVKGLECCEKLNNKCDECPYRETGCQYELSKDALDLINRQQAEIERLQNEIGSLNKKYPCTVRLGEHCIMYARSLDDYDKQIGDISSEAIKEFAEKLNEQFKVLEYMPKTQRKTLPVVVVKQQVDGILQNGCPHIVNKTLKEMVGDDK